MSREGQGAGAGPSTTRRMLECLSSVMLLRPIGYEISPEIVYFVAEKLLKLFELPPPAIWFAAPSRHASAVSARGTSRRRIHARTSCPAQALLISRERQSQS
jgi:hypothetical protein